MYSCLAARIGLSLFLSLLLFLDGSALAQVDSIQVPIVSPNTVASFSFEDVARKAEALAREPFAEQVNNIDSRWSMLSYDDYRSIRFKPEFSLWRGDANFEVQFFHQGFIYERAIKINQVIESEAQEVPCDSGVFRYDSPIFDAIPRTDVQCSGLRVHYPLHSGVYKDEFLVFQGASYFRLLGRKQRYGISARGLAVDTGLPKGEEFPAFKEFWLVKPAKDSRTLVIYALLDSPSVTGAYQFEVFPATNTQVDVKGKLFFRQAVEKIGVAPLTSMFFFGENRERFFDDFRPEVHDSDGLLIKTSSGEWLWRPLENRNRLNISTFSDNNLQGFGLLQRDIRFSNYQDLDADYHLRPSYWIEPRGTWGKGHVELIEIPSNSEVNDNMVAFWVPEMKTEAGTSHEFSYRISSFHDTSILSPGGKVIATRIGSTSSTEDPAVSGRKFVIDFVGGELDYLDRDQAVQGIVTASSGAIKNLVAHKNQNSKGWRLFFDFYPEEGQSADLRAFLRLGEDVLTETWNYLWARETKGF